VADVAEVLAQMRRVAARIPSLRSSYALAAPSFHSPASKAKIHALDVELAAPVPADYRAFLALCGRVSAMDVHNGYDLLPPPLALRIRRQDAIPKAIDAVAVLPIAADGGGNLFLLGVHPPHEVWKWNHEIGAARDGALPSESEALSHVSYGFTAFLQRVVQDWEHFAEGDDAWPFLVA
jgi:hypothetical protein